MSGDDHAHLEAIADAIREETCVLFLGAGVHAPPPVGSTFNYPEDARPPFASALSERLARSARFPHRFPNEGPADLTRVALFFEHFIGRGMLEDEIQSAVQEGKEPSPILHALAEIGFPIVITTNYDRLFETALDAAGRNPSAFVYGVDFGSPRRRYGSYRSLRNARHGRERDHYERLLTAHERFHNATAASPVVLKVHGDIGHPGTIVVTDEDYIRIANQIGIVAEYVGLAASETRGWTTLIVGYRMVDFDFRQIFTLYTDADEDLWRPSSKYAVDPAPDELLSEIWEEDRGVKYIRSNVWCFVPDLYKLVLGKEMPN